MTLNLQKVNKEYDRIMSKHQEIIKRPLSDFNLKITQSEATGNIKVKGSIPLITHPYHGDTKIVVNATYRQSDNEPDTYDYGWKLDKIGGPQTIHISAWGKEPHPNMGLETDPYHHHHVPFDRPKRKECYTVRDLDHVLEFISNLIKQGVQYNQNMNT